MRLKRTFFNTLLWAGLLLCCLQSKAQSQTPEAGLVELFSGAELTYSDVNYVRLYNVLLNLTPGVKWHLGNDWMVSGQMYLPLVNDGYAQKYNNIRLNNAAVAKQLHLGTQHFKVTGGLFGMSRYGLDLRWMYPVNEWLMLNAQLGYTGHWWLAVDDAREMRGRVLIEETKGCDFGSPDRFTGILGASVWWEPWQTETRLSGGRYLNKDYGVQFDVMRHFKHCTVGLFFQMHERGLNKYHYRESGGFKVVFLLPDVKWQDRKFTLRPADNFLLSYNAQADGASMKMYTTDPEESERTYPVRIPWGTGLLDR